MLGSQSAKAPEPHVRHSLSWRGIAIGGCLVFFFALILWGADANGQETTGAPWGISAATDRLTTPDLVKRALPPVFLGYQLNREDIPGFSHPRPREFALEAESFAYFEPGDLEGTIQVLVQIDQLKPGVAATEAIASVLQLGESKPRFAVEQLQVDPASPVPFALTSETNVGGSERYSLSWAAADGAWLFTISATSPEQREAFARELATRMALEATIATATAYPQAAPATIASLQTAVSNLQATVEAVSFESNQIIATATAYADEATEKLEAAQCVLEEEATAVAEVAATATAFAKDVEPERQAVAALATSVSGLIAAPATMTANAVELATKSAQVASLQATATILSEQASGGFVDPDAHHEFAIDVDVTELLDRFQVAEDDAVAQIRAEFANFSGCQVGFVQTFGYSPDISEGVRVAEAVNELMRKEFAETFANAVFDGFANVGSSRGTVEIVLFFYRGCDAFSESGWQSQVVPINAFRSHEQFENTPRPTTTMLPTQTPTDEPTQTPTKESTPTSSPSIVQQRRTPEPVSSTGSGCNDTGEMVAPMQAGATAISSPTPTPLNAQIRSYEEADVLGEFPQAIGATTGLKFSARGLFFYADGTTITIGDGDGTPIASFPGSSPVWSPQGGVLLYQDGSELAIWDADTAEVSSITAQAQGEESVYDIAAGWNGPQLLYIRRFLNDAERAEFHTSDWNGANDYVLWDGQLRDILAQPVATTDGVWVVTSDGWVQLFYDGGAGDPRPNPWGLISEPVASPFGSVIAFVTGDGQLIVVTASSPEVQFITPIPDGGAGFAFSPDGASMVVANENGLATYDWQSGSQIGQLDGEAVAAPGWGSLGIYAVTQGQVPTLIRFPNGSV